MVETIFDAVDSNSIFQHFSAQDNYIARSCISSEAESILLLSWMKPGLEKCYILRKLAPRFFT
jgi:hypothetical protein